MKLGRRCAVSPCVYSHTALRYSSNADDLLTANDLLRFYHLEQNQIDMTYDVCVELIAKYEPSEFARDEVGMLC